MTVQNFLKTLKTAKRASSAVSTSLSHEITNSLSQTPFKTLLNSNSSSKPTSQSCTQTSVHSFLTSLTSYQLQSLLSDPAVKTSDCFRIFNLVIHSQSYLSFKPTFHSHFTLICRLIKSRYFSDAEFLLKKLFLDPLCRYPFEDFINWVEKYCKESKIITKLLNMSLKVYSNHGMFDMAFKTFDYMVKNEIERDERTCSVHLSAMTKADKIDLSLEFLRRMLDSGMTVSVFSLTIVASGLCKTGELQMTIELVEEMTGRGIKPNIITFNTLVDACTRRWDFEKLAKVLCLMQQEGIEFNDATYKLLIEGYSGSGKVDKAEKLLLEMHAKGIEVETYLFHTVIRGYFRLGSISSGLSLFRRMQEMEVPPCGDIYWTLIRGLCRVGEMCQVKELVNEMRKNGIELDDDMLRTVMYEYDRACMVDALPEIQSTVKEFSPTLVSCDNSTTSEYQGNLMVDGDTKAIADILEYVKSTIVEEMDVDDVLKAYVSSENH